MCASLARTLRQKRGSLLDQKAFELLVVVHFALLLRNNVMPISDRAAAAPARRLRRCSLQGKSDLSLLLVDPKHLRSHDVTHRNNR
jgi:hypothetical protein